MIDNKQKDIVQWVIDTALQKGCQATRVSLTTAVNNSFEYRNTQLDKLHNSTENRLYIELFVDGKYGSFSTNRMEPSELAAFIESGIASTRYLAKDNCRQLPNASRYYSGNTPLDLCDNSFYEVTAEQKIDVIKLAVEEVYGTDQNILSVSAAFDDGIESEYMADSNGFEGESQESAFNLTVEVSLKTQGDARAESFWFDSAIYWNELQKKGIATKALDRARCKIGQQKIKSGKYTMLLDNTVSPRMIAPLISAMYGSALQQRNSFLLDKLNSQITAPIFTIKDTPHLTRAFGARWYDGEGVATHNRTIIDKGILSSYFIDTYHSLKMDMQPTIASPSILITNLGDRNFDQILSSLDKAIWVTGLNGGNCNPTTGDFSFGIEGFLISKGAVSTPISEMNITGNILTMWQNLNEIGNDPRESSSRRIPALLFDDINFSGI